MKKFVILILFIQFYACSESQTSIKHNSKAEELNKKALNHIISAEYEAALILLDQAIALDSSFDLPHKNKFRIFFKQKDFKQALAESEAILKINPDQTEWLLNRGMILDRFKEIGQARSHYLKALALIEKDLHKPSEQDNVGAHLLVKGITLVLIGQEEKGWEIINEIIDATPENELIKGLRNISKKQYLENYLDKQIYYGREND